MKIKMKFIYTFIFIITASTTNAQTNYLMINPNINLPKDSTESKNLTNSLNDFLLAAQKPNIENRLVYDSQKIETFIQLDEVRGIEKSKRYNDDFFFKPYLTNIVQLKDANYLVQVSYIGTSADTAVLRASFEFIAYKTNNSFKFSSPLLQNTKNWKVKKIGNNIFHYQNTINKEKVKGYNKLSSSFDLKLNLTNKITDHYCGDNLIEMQKLIGVEYKSDYNGQAENVWSSTFGDRKIIILGNNNSSFNNFDPHDLFHERLSLVISRSKVNKSVDEGCAYYYGGSWGFTWKAIFKEFTEDIASNRETNWMKIKEEPITFKTGDFSNSADYIVNALLVQKIEQEKGFAGVWELLNVGPFEKGNEKYYQILEKLTGITKASYNEKVWELINKEKWK